MAILRPFRSRNLEGVLQLFRLLKHRANDELRPLTIAHLTSARLRPYSAGCSPFSPPISLSLIGHPLGCAEDVVDFGRRAKGGKLFQFRHMQSSSTVASSTGFPVPFGWLLLASLSDSIQQKCPTAATPQERVSPAAKSQRMSAAPDHLTMASSGYEWALSSSFWRLACAGRYFRFSQSACQSCEYRI